MKVSKLIKLLKEMPQDLEVVSYCDHGQTPEFSQKPSLMVIPSEEFKEGDMESVMSLGEALELGYSEKELVKIVML